MMGAMALRRVRLTSLAVVLVTGSLILLLMAAEPLLASLAQQSVLASGGSLPLPFSVAFAVVGFVVAWRKPGNLLGWLILGVAGFLALSEDASFYAVVDYRLPSRRWRWALWPYLALALPVCTGIGILKYRLFDIDRIISRTLAHALLTGLLVGVYAGLVLLATRVLPLSSPVAVAGSTLVAVALCTPLRRQVQRAVDRRFNRARHDVDQTVAMLAARLQDAVDLDSVRADLVATMSDSLQPTHVSVWLGEGGR
jgi:hypothetical protein